MSCSIDFHGFVRAPELVIRARLLVQHLVAMRVVRILLEQRVVQLDRLERTRLLEIAANAFRHVEAARGLCAERRAAAAIARCSSARSDSVTAAG